MRKNRPTRIMFSFGFVICVLAAIMNLKTSFQFECIIPNIRYVSATVNFVSAVLCIILVIKPEWNIVQYVLLALESVLTTIIGFIGIGAMLMMFMCLLLFVNGFFVTRPYLKLIVIILLWFCVDLLVYPGLGLRYMLLSMILALFYVAMYVVIYSKLEEKLSYLLPKNEVSAKNKDMPEHGAELNLNDYGLTKRQIRFLILAIKEGLSYEQIGDANFISVSVVKKEMAACCKAFGVKNREALRILLLQYKLIY